MGGGGSTCRVESRQTGSEGPGVSPDHSLSNQTKKQDRPWRDHQPESMAESEEELDLPGQDQPAPFSLEIDYPSTE